MYKSEEHLLRGKHACMAVLKTSQFRAGNLKEKCKSEYGLSSDPHTRHLQNPNIDHVIGLEIVAKLFVSYYSEHTLSQCLHKMYVLNEVLNGETNLIEVTTDLNSLKVSDPTCREVQDYILANRDIVEASRVAIKAALDDGFATALIIAFYNLYGLDPRY